MILLALLLAALSLGATLSLVARVRRLEGRLRSITSRPPALERAEKPESSLVGLRIEIAIRQDHPLSPFETLLGEALTNEGAVVVEREADVRISGTLKGNGFADVYFDADVQAEAGGRTLLQLRERPPHGDRPANLALEAVERLKSELAKRERQGALRELRGD